MLFYLFGRGWRNRTFNSLLYQEILSLTISATVHVPVCFATCIQPQLIWCLWRDLNSQALQRHPLKMVCLPDFTTKALYSLNFLISRILFQTYHLSKQQPELISREFPSFVCLAHYITVVKRYRMCDRRNASNDPNLYLLLALWVCPELPHFCKCDRSENLVNVNK